MQYFFNVKIKYLKGYLVVLCKMNFVQVPIYTNSHDIVFNIQPIQMDDQKHFALIYRCTICGNFLLKNRSKSTFLYPNT